jgi:hypothetical protein
MAVRARASEQPRSLILGTRLGKKNSSTDRASMMIAPECRQIIPVVHDSRSPFSIVLPISAEGHRGYIRYQL